MNIPSYLLSLPDISHSTTAIESFENLYSDQIEHAAGKFASYDLALPKWQFLNYLAESKAVLFHGSGASDIDEFEPRKSVDADDFGDQKAVYASSDAIWATFFAIVNRPRYVRSLSNTCVRKPVSADAVKSLYFFSINADAFEHQPWRPGTLYVLPRKSFEPQASDPDNGTAQWRSFEQVRPLAKLTVSPEDFPFLNDIRGHDTETLIRRAKANPKGFPWLDD